MLRPAESTLCLVATIATSCGFPALAPIEDITLELIAGTIGGQGNGDGIGATARFSHPRSLAVDRAGNVFVADLDNRTIRKISPSQEVTTLAGAAGLQGFHKATGREASFNTSGGVVVDGAGNLYVPDTGDHAILKVTPDGVVMPLDLVEIVDVPRDARFVAPSSIAIDSDGDLYVADDHAILKVTMATRRVMVLAGTRGANAFADGRGEAARFNSPSAIAVDGAKNVYVADTENFAIRKITVDGEVTTRADNLNRPGGIAVDAAGDIYVADTDSSTLRKVTAAGVVTLTGTTGEGHRDGTTDLAQFLHPAGLAMDGAGNLYIADKDNHLIRKLALDGQVTTLAGLAAESGTPYQEDPARFHGPVGVTVDSAGNIYVADAGNGAVRKIDIEGVVTMLPGISGPQSYQAPQAVAVDSAGNVYVADTATARVVAITTDGVVRTLAGMGAAGSAGEVGFAYPSGVAIDGAGNIIVADTNNAIIRRITTTGVVTTVAGSERMWGSDDGTGPAARLASPRGIAVDGDANLYVADGNIHVIRKIDDEARVTTLAGTAGQAGHKDEAGRAARFSLPTSVAVDHSGNVYVADTGNATIRKITPRGITTTIAGTPGVVGIVLGEPPRLASPRGVAIDGDSLIISDANAILRLRHAVR